MWVDETLSWGTHSSEVSGKVAKALAALRRLKPICLQEILVSIYISLILPYCSFVQGNIGAGLSQRLEKLQNRATNGTGWDVTSPQILHDFNWMSLTDRQTNQLKTLMFKTVNRQVPKCISEKLSTPIPFTDIICGACNTISLFQDPTLRHLVRFSGIGVLSYGIVSQSRLSRLLV